MVVIVAAALAFVLLLSVAGERTVADAVAWARFEEVHWSHINTYVYTYIYTYVYAYICTYICT